MYDNVIDDSDSVVLPLLVYVIHKAANVTYQYKYLYFVLLYTHQYILNIFYLNQCVSLLLDKSVSCLLLYFLFAFVKNHDFSVMYWCLLTE